MPSSDKVVASLGDALLRQSDVELLKGPHWLNDGIIGFYFEHLHQTKFDASDRLCFLSPEVSQFLKLAGAAELPVFLEPLALEAKDLVLAAVNNATDPDSPGGSHWSLLIFSRQAKEFFHLDSSSGMNDMDARLLAKKLYDFLVKKLEQRYFNLLHCLCRFKTKTISYRFPMTFTEVPVLKQTNGYDCGIHLLSHAEHATRHYLVYGNADGLDPLDAAAVKNKRKEILDLVMSYSAGEAPGGGGGKGEAT